MRDTSRSSYNGFCYIFLAFRAILLNEKCNFTHDTVVLNNNGWSRERERRGPIFCAKFLYLPENLELNGTAKRGDLSLSCG